MHAGTPREHVAEPLAALDVTFSPSKSVSALWAAHPSESVRVSVIESHEAAVAAGLAYLEANASHTRSGAGGLRRIESSGFIVAKFRHRTSRSTAPGDRVGDPQLHSHCAILNRVRGADGSVAHTRLEGDLPTRPRRGRPVRSSARTRAHQPARRRVDHASERRASTDARDHRDARVGDRSLVVATSTDDGDL